MDKQQEELAALYVLDLLSGAEKADFEKQLEQSTELQQLVREFGHGLHSPLKEASGPRRPDLLEGIHEKIGINEQKPQAAPVATSPVPWRYIWGVAAVFMLMLNLILVVVLSNQAAVRGGELLPETNPDMQASLESRISTLERELNTRTSAMNEIASAHKVVLKENAEIKEDLTEWQQEYMEMSSKVLPFFDSRDGMSRFTVIELVDARPDTGDASSQAYMDLAGYFLTGQEAKPLLDARMAASGNNSVEPAVGTSKPMGFTIWREEDRKGFLDIYNLPELSRGEDYFLWVRSSRSEPFLPIGHLPELHNGDGSIFYSVNNEDFDRPREILITAERAAQPGSPSANRFLVGP
ncbi:MAG: hypothetical protein AB3N63_02855 [Puniceicoccaceae bacterium]